ncbi:VOC family protein [Terribacillus sp. DMT04]|uniref:VOC family protein n=1 Tax=Terribacillus sp. DMT04 TaxID=2850441 RepID=UPI001C2C20C9|nr:VOC family protein [Terribacillus sp. DMT04]QXE01594.1 VOC family protein [Terribacillus sp. DMT04]
MAEFHISSVFDHVKDANEVANWYAKLLGKSEPHPTTGPVQFMELGDERGLIIDDNRNNVAGIRPAVMLETEETQLAYKKTAQAGKIVRELEEDEAVGFFNFQDPDGNIVMVCQQKK